MLCHVCGAPGAEPHFGGISCRACAAFFRRYAHSKKLPGACTCSTRYRNSHPCRECRVQKCIEVGMDFSQVQEKREKHVKPIVSSASTSCTSSTPSSPSSSSSNYSLQLQIIPRDNYNISKITLDFSQVQYQRDPLYEKTLDETTYYQMSCNLREDTGIVWKIVETWFPNLLALTRLDRDALLRNFLPKWSILASAIDFEANMQRYQKVKSCDDYQRMIVDFYTHSMPEYSRMSKEDILNVFQPILLFYGLQVITPICEKQFDKAEYMALALLILFDGAYTNISVECSEMCRNIRKIVFRELRNYQIEKNNELHELRFPDTIDTLSIIEKGERKYQEELLICEMHNVQLPDDFRMIMLEQNL